MEYVKGTVKDRHKTTQLFDGRVLEKWNGLLKEVKRLEKTDAIRRTLCRKKD
jgi:hypothetical protein